MVEGRLKLRVIILRTRGALKALGNQEAVCIWSTSCIWKWRLRWYKYEVVLDIKSTLFQVWHCNFSSSKYNGMSTSKKGLTLPYSTLLWAYCIHSQEIQFIACMRGPGSYNILMVAETWTLPDRIYLWVLNEKKQATAENSFDLNLLTI